MVAFEEEDLDGEEANFDPYAFIKGLPPLESCAGDLRLSWALPCCMTPSGQLKDPIQHLR